MPDSPARADRQSAQPEPADAVTPSGLLDGRLNLAQPAKGHRAGTDALLLAAAGPLNFDGLCLDFGAGPGAAGLCFALLEPKARIGLVEIDPGLAAMARRNLQVNRLADRGFVSEGDLLAPTLPPGLTPGRAALVLTNPPYLDAARARPPADSGRRLAYVMPEGGLIRWLSAAALALAPGGLLVMIHRADQLSVLLAALAAHFGAVRLRPVHPREGADASRILVAAVKGGRAALVVRPGLILHGAGNGFTDQIEAVHRGRVRIDL